MYCIVGQGELCQYHASKTKKMDRFRCGSPFLIWVAHKCPLQSEKMQISNGGDINAITVTGSIIPPNLEIFGKIDYWLQQTELLSLWKMVQTAVQISKKNRHQMSRDIVKGRVRNRKRYRNTDEMLYLTNGWGENNSRIFHHWEHEDGPGWSGRSYRHFEQHGPVAPRVESGRRRGSEIVAAVLG